MFKPLLDVQFLAIKDISVDSDVHPRHPSSSRLLPFGPLLNSWMLCMSVFQFHLWPPSLIIPFTFSLCFFFPFGWFSLCAFISLHKYLLKISYERDPVFIFYALEYANEQDHWGPWTGERGDRDGRARVGEGLRLRIFSWDLLYNIVFIFNNLVYKFKYLWRGEIPGNVFITEKSRGRGSRRKCLQEMNILLPCL